MPKHYTNVDSWFSDMKSILVEYSDEVQEKVNDAVGYVADYATKELKTSAGSFQNRTGKYRKGWRFKIENIARYYTAATVFNYKYYPLTHLLESGHSKWLWGRYTGEDVKAFPHIGQVQEEADRKIVEEVERALRT